MTLLNNKKALRDFEIIERFEAGIELFGFEVKSLRAGQGSLRGSFVTVDPSGAKLVNAHIPPFQPKNTPESYDPERPRRLLLHKKELRELSQKLDSKGLTVVPVSLYNKGRLVKIEIALVRGTKKHDKREKIKKRDDERDIERDVKSRVRF